MTSEMDAAALGVGDDMVEIVSPRPTWQPPVLMKFTDPTGDTLSLEASDDGLELGICDNVEFYGSVVLDPAKARDLILALQQWLATKEGLG